MQVPAAPCPYRGVRVGVTAGLTVFCLYVVYLLALKQPFGQLTIVAQALFAVLPVPVWMMLQSAVIPADRPKAGHTMSDREIDQALGLLGPPPALPAKADEAPAGGAILPQIPPVATTSLGSAQTRPVEVEMPDQFRGVFPDRLEIPVLAPDVSKVQGFQIFKLYSYSGTKVETIQNGHQAEAAQKVQKPPETQKAN
jgi:hypothetical protein